MSEEITIPLDMKYRWRIRRIDEEFEQGMRTDFIISMAIALAILATMSLSYYCGWQDGRKAQEQTMAGFLDNQLQELGR